MAEMTLPATTNQASAPIDADRSSDFGFAGTITALSLTACGGEPAGYGTAVGPPASVEKTLQRGPRGALATRWQRCD